MTLSSRFKAPDTTLVIFSIIVLAAVMTWVVPPGAFEKTTIQVEGVGAREVVVPGTFSYIDRPAESFIGRVVHSIGMILKAPILGIIHPGTAPIVAFVLLIGGAFGVLARTGAVETSLRRIVQRSEQSERLRRMLIPIFMVLFSFGGAVFGMSEEVIPFILIFVPLALALGYDSVTGVAIPFLGSTAGFTAAFINPFTLQVAQGIAGLPPLSGQLFRVVLWVVVTAFVIAFVMWHAARVKRNPEKSPTFELDKKKREEGLHLNEEGSVDLSQRQVAVLVVFFLGIGALVAGVLIFGWYIIEIAALFIAIGILMGIVGGLGANETAESFMAGARDLVATAILIGLARGILVVLEDGQIVDTVLYALSSALGDVGPGGSATAMFGVQTVINFFVPSGSGQAALTMPLMAPLADLLGVSRQIAVLAYQMGDGFTNMIIPTSAVLMGSLTLAGVPWPSWARWILPLQLFLFALGVVVLFIAVAIGFS
ncbi:YfcC family protein [soil metagenome]